MSLNQEGIPGRSCAHSRSHSPPPRWRPRRPRWRRWRWMSTGKSRATWQGESQGWLGGESARGLRCQERGAHSGRGICPSGCSQSYRCCCSAASASHRCQCWPPSWVGDQITITMLTSLPRDGGVATAGGREGWRERRHQLPPSSWTELERHQLARGRPAGTWQEQAEPSFTIGGTRGYPGTCLRLAGPALPPATAIVFCPPLLPFISSSANHWIR